MRIDSGLLDRRTDYRTHTYMPVQAPLDVERALFAYLRHFGIVFDAFDFTLSADGTGRFRRHRAAPAVRSRRTTERRDRARGPRQAHPDCAPDRAP
ncbi:hypothetical protein ACWD5V_16185 [Streptomyces sp. NPDC002523]